ncbi:unnamed protein product [Musa banksii]
MELPCRREQGNDQVGESHGSGCPCTHRGQTRRRRSPVCLASVRLRSPGVAGMTVSNDGDGGLADDLDITSRLAEVCSWVVKVAYRVSMGLQLPNGASFEKCQSKLCLSL